MFVLSYPEVERVNKILHLTAELETSWLSVHSLATNKQVLVSREPIVLSLL